MDNVPYDHLKLQKGVKLTSDMLKCFPFYYKDFGKAYSLKFSAKIFGDNWTFDYKNCNRHFLKNLTSSHCWVAIYQIYLFLCTT